MKIRTLKRDICSFKEYLDGKRRIMTYGAGSWANDIKKILEEYGYQLDYAIVDAPYCAGNTFTDTWGVMTTTFEELTPSYDFKSDILIWAIGSPEKLRNCMKDDQMEMECFLLWDRGLWKEKDFYILHEKEFNEASELFCDAYSKKVFWSYIEAQKGNIHEDILYSTNGTYFNELTKDKRSGCFLDCGSYDGESAIAYMKFIGEECQVYAFEPDRDNYQKLVNRMKNRTNFICLNKGCYSAEKMLSFESNGDMSSSIQETGDEMVEVTTIDKVVGDEKVAFIKMDVEGAELAALKGGRKVIERDMPILAISAYHRQEDLITLIPYISNLHNESERYNLYLRHHGVMATELVIYGIPTTYDLS